MIHEHPLKLNKINSIPKTLRKDPIKSINKTIKKSTGPSGASLPLAALGWPAVRAPWYPRGALLAGWLSVSIWVCLKMGYMQFHDMQELSLHDIQLDLHMSLVDPWAFVSGAPWEGQIGSGSLPRHWSAFGTRAKGALPFAVQLRTFFDWTIQHHLLPVWAQSALPRCIGSGARCVPVLATLRRDPWQFQLGLRPLLPCNLGGAPNLLSNNENISGSTR